MCGIVAIWQKNNELADPDVLTRMRDRLTSRGPDDAGIWINNNIGLAHRRLSILDVSQLGHQPMVDEETGSVIVYNGEVYNFREIRKDLQARGIQFKSQTDTEVVLKAYREWGSDCLNRFVGMFSFAIWDVSRQGLFIGRDRLGIKPLYYHLGKGVLLFASRLKALLAYPRCPRQIDTEALGLYLDMGFVPAPWSILKDIRKLQPGHYLWIDNKHVEDRCYWSIDNVPINGALKNAPHEALVDQLESLLKDSVRSRMISDVPLGSFLSGGIDSSVVTAMMASCSGCPPKTFTIGFKEKDYNEADDARQISHILGTEHYEKVMQTEDLLELLDDIKEHYDEPFADSSSLPTMMLSRFSRKHVTVCLSGDGGDELFAGYRQYHILSYLKYGFHLPDFLRSGIGRLLAKTGQHRAILLGHSLCQKDLLGSFSYIRSVIKDFQRNKLVQSDGVNMEYLFRSRSKHFPEVDSVSEMSRLDIAYYLADDILQKVDVASMSVGLEARIPILDHRVVEFALSMPIGLKWHYRGGKRLLKDVLARYIPLTYFKRPKTGFEVPLNDWFRGQLKEMIQDELSLSAIKQFGLLNPDKVQTLVSLHLSGKRNTHPILWSLLSLLQWNKQLKKF